MSLTGNCYGWAIATSLLCCPTCEMESCDTCLCCPTCDTLKQVNMSTCPCLLTFRIMNFLLPVGTFIIYTRSTGTTFPGRVVDHNEDGTYRVDYQVDENFLTSDCEIPPVLPTCDVAIAQGGGGYLLTVLEMKCGAHFLSSLSATS